MVTRVGPLATINCEPRQAWKGAAAAVDSCAGVWLVRVATLIFNLTHQLNRSDLDFIARPLHSMAALKFLTIVR